VGEEDLDAIFGTEELLIVSGCSHRQ